ncbi:MAG: DUF1926 domain-containing protein [Candidatus Aminicenantes bacterium]|nr:DUF1926 domain-containing protein [Candidatus Aminicenantes bacterium]
MSREFAFLFGIHNHQPVGNFGWVFDQAADDCYIPFLKVMRSHPSVKFSAHYSGPLLEYFADERPEAWDLLGEMITRGQMELLGGGFYEPILSIIPDEDRRGQVEMMSGYLEKHFGRKPRGLWLTERVWEPSLASNLARSGIEYTLLDENHFHSSHLPDLRGIYITEDQGFPLRLLAIDQKLRYLIPFRELEEIGAYFAEIRRSGGWAVLGDDGEKFGVWPGTKAWVYEKGWLVRFLRFIEDNRIPTMTFGEAVSSGAPAARIYPPPASYEEMTEWVLEPEDESRFRRLKSSIPEAEARGFLRAGSFLDFFRKYPESRRLRDRMLGISRAVRSHGLPAAVSELYRGQGNDPYWHGVFGGLYLPHLREAAWEHLLKAEAMCPAPSGWTAGDWDLDGRDEYAWRNGSLGVWVEQENGGVLAELDSFRLYRNLSDVLARRRESYHLIAGSEPMDESGEGRSIHEIAKVLPPGTERLIVPDRGPLRSAVVRFHDPKTDPAAIASGEAEGRGDIAGGLGPAEIKGERLVFRQSGRVTLTKEFIPLDRKFRVEIDIRNDGNERMHFITAVEWNLYQLPEEMEARGSLVSLCRGAFLLAGPSDAALRIHPLLTLSQSEKGFDTIHQGFRLVWFREVELGRGERTGFVFEAGESDAF